MRKHLFIFAIKDINKQNVFTFFTEKLDAARAFMIICVLLYGVAFLLLASNQILKKDIFQKTVAPTFWSICKLTYFVLEFLAKIDVLSEQFFPKSFSVGNTTNICD